MIKMHLIKSMLIIFILNLIISGCSNSSDKSNASSGKENGGDIHVAIDAQPPTLDPQISTTMATRSIARHIFEQLVTIDSKYKVVPMLAESYTVSPDKLTYTFNLRKGITFHNDKEMQAEDVVASLNRWLTLSTRAKSTIGSDASFTAKDEYTVVLNTKQASNGVLETIADPNQFSAVMPKEIIESAPEGGVKEIVGTGPFKFVDWKQDQTIELEKFNDYKPVEAKADGLSGKKEALVDRIFFDIVTDASTRLAGLQTEQYQIALGIPYDNYSQIESDPNLASEVSLFGGNAVIFNKEKGIFTDQKMRQAINMAVNNEDILRNAFSNEKFYRVDNGLMYKEQSEWYTDSGKEYFNQHDTEKAKQLLKEAGYNGDTISILTTRDYDYMYNTAVVLKEQLQAVGINSKLNVVDWATLTQKRADPNAYDIFTTTLSVVGIPTQILPLDATWPGWADDKKIKEYMNGIRTAKTQEEGKKYFEQLQEYNWKEYVSYVKLGDLYLLSAYNKKVNGFKDFNGTILWNTTVEK